MSQKPDIITNIEWTCPICGKGKFKTPDEAIECRDKHVMPEKIIGATYLQGAMFPSILTAVYPPGFVVVFHVDKYAASDDWHYPPPKKKAQKSCT